MYLLIAPGGDVCISRMWLIRGVLKLQKSRLIAKKCKYNRENLSKRKFSVNHVRKALPKGILCMQRISHVGTWVGIFIRGERWCSHVRGDVFPAPCQSLKPESHASVACPIQ